MLKKLKKKLQQRRSNSLRRLTAALGTAVVLALPGPAAAFDINDTFSGDSIGDNGLYNTSSVSTVTITGTGTVTGTAGCGIVNRGTITTLTNSGTVTGTVAGIYNDSGTITALTNSGTIAGTNYAIYNQGTIGAIYNTGTISGDNGIYNTSSVSTVTITGTGTVTGTAGCGIVNRGTITTLTNSGTISGTGTNGFGIENQGTITTLNNSGTIAGTNYAIYNQGTIGAIYNTGTISSNGYCIYVDDNSSADVVSESGGTLLGATYVSASGGTLNLTLNNGSTWTNTGDSSLTNLTLGGGAVRFAAPSANTYHSITIKNALTGSGAFYLNSNLASGLADCLVVDGTASGSYQLVVSNTGGAVKSNPAVKVVDIASGAASSATFSGGTDVGAYRYSIAQGTAISSYSGVNGLEDYYYYSSGPSTPAQAAIAENSGTVVAWYGELNEIKKRLGDLRMGAQTSDDLWARIYADKYSVLPGGGNAYNQIMRGVEIGRDNPQSYKGGKKYTGFLLGYGKADTTYSGGGSGKADSNYVGAYASWLKDDGAYLDLIGKYNWLRHDFTTPVLGGTEDSGLYRNQALGLSLEFGKHIERGNGVFIEPQIELASLWSKGASYTTTQGLAVDVPSARSLQLRIGCAAGQKWTDRDGASRQVYGKVSWVNEYAGDSTTRVDTASFDSSLKGHQWVTGIGFVEDTKRYQLYLDVEKSWGSDTSKEWGMNTGMRWKF